MAGVKLWSPDGADCQIGLTSGHTFVIPGAEEGIEVPARFRREAIARGCLPVGMKPDDDEEGGAFDRTKVLRDCINKMLDSNEPGMFTKDGKPNLNKLSALAGFTVDRAEMNKILDGMKVTAGDPDNDSRDETISTL